MLTKGLATGWSPAGAALGVALSLTLAMGCGGEEKQRTPTPDSGTDGKQLTVSEYRRRANALCARGLRELRQIPAPTSAEQIGTYFDQVLRVTRRYDKEEERALEPPPKEVRAVHERAERIDARVMAGLERAVSRIEASANPQVTAQRELQKLALIADEEVALARRLGLKQCINFGQPGQERGA